jgi:hypothetical protein
VKQARFIPGRHLGWSEQDLKTKPYARFWNPELAPLSQAAREALLVGGVAQDMIPPYESANDMFFSGKPTLETGYTFASDGSVRVAIETDMPGVEPYMWDWWFGWHSDSPERYKLWHPQAHMHAYWDKDPPKGTRNRERYVGYTSIVDEYVGSDFMRFAISFVSPRSVGLTHPSLDDPTQATAICAKGTIKGVPVTTGNLIHMIQKTPTGSRMRSRFWVGGSNIVPRGLIGIPVAAMARMGFRSTETDARNLLVHCAQEMTHLAKFLPALYAQCRDMD